MNKYIKYSYIKYGEYSDTYNKQYILEFPPHKRTINYGGNNVFINIPFYTIFKISTSGLKNEVITRQHGYTNSIFGKKEPFRSIDDYVYKINYPHVCPLSGTICQILNVQCSNFDYYTELFINQFWSANNKFFMDHNLIPTKYCHAENVNDIKEVKLIENSLKIKIGKKDPLWIAHNEQTSQIHHPK